MKGIRACAAAAAITVTGLVQAAAPDIKPGLWEMKVEKVSGAGANGMPKSVDMEKAMKQMQAQLANMPPEQRKMIEDQMNAMGVAATGSGGIRVCLAEEDIKRNDIPLGDESCKTTIKTQTAKRWAASVVCTQPPTTGEVEAIFESNTAYLVKMQGKRTEQGKSMDYNMEMRAKFVAADCGKLKPVSQLQPKKK